MSLFSDIRTFLLSKPEISNLVGERIYPNQLKARIELPAIVIQKFNGSGDAGVNFNSNVWRNRVQIDCHAEDESEADDLMELVDAAFRPVGNFQGSMGSRFIHSIVAEGDDRQGNDAPTNGDEDFRYWSSRDYEFVHELT